MNKLILAASTLLLSTGLALAQTTPAPATKPGDAPTKAMDSATPDMKSKDDPSKEHPPAAAMDKAVPPMKSGDAPAPDSSDPVSCEVMRERRRPAVPGLR